MNLPSASYLGVSPHSSCPDFHLSEGVFDDVQRLVDVGHRVLRRKSVVHGVAIVMEVQAAGQTTEQEAFFQLPSLGFVHD